MASFVDHFIGAANDDLVTVHDGTNWAVHSTGSAKLGASGNSLIAVGSGPGLGATPYYKGVTPTLGTDYYAQCKYVAGSYPCLYVGYQNGSDSGYLLVNTGDVYKVVSGALGSVLQNVGAFSATDIMYIEKTELAGVVTLKCKKNGSTVGTPQVDSASPLLNGTSGILFYAGGGEVTDFTTDNISSGTNFPLNAAAGSYAVTGSNETSVVAWTQNAAAGAYSVTGANATLVSSAGVSYPMNAVAGSYIVTGTDFTNVAAYNLNAAPGTYAVTGADAVIGKFVSVAFTAGAGSYAVTGAATGPVAWSLNAGPGSYRVSFPGSTKRVTRQDGQWFTQKHINPWYG